MSPYKRLLKTASVHYLTKISQIAESDAALAFISSKAASMIRGTCWRTSFEIKTIVTIEAIVSIVRERRLGSEGICQDARKIPIRCNLRRLRRVRHRLQSPMESTLKPSIVVSQIVVERAVET